MAKILNFNTHSDNRGSLTVIEKIIPFDVKRIFYIYDVDNSKRGFHKHKLTRQLAVCIKGSCEIIVENSKKHIYKLDSPEKGLIIEPEDYHWMKNFSKESILLVMASEYYDKKDYIFKK
jgi:dTDP-4-dehydrorhamnose 3,5-epimerase-like enzyme|tara:strand:+ start:731 stop:1087 length:357 start_codon:yes stop_codon:yes gene_type:complete